MERLGKNNLQEIGESEVLSFWKHNTSPVSLYIHNPFCVSICGFCAYRGMKPNAGDIDRYYARLLPLQLLSYKEVIELSNVTSCFFGGGTPSLIPSKYLRKILEFIPRSKSIREKYFELHPAFVNLEVLDILAEYDFNNIIIGVQSFDKGVLQKTNRRFVSEESVGCLIAEIHRRNMFAWMDIVGFINQNENELSILETDIYKAVSLSPDEISICPNFCYKHTVTDKAVDVIYNCVEKIPDYYLYNSEKNYDKIKKLYTNKKAIRLIKKTCKVESFMHYIAINDRPDSQKQSILGVGSYENENRDTFSICRTTNFLVKYVERMEARTPKYYIVL